MAKAGQIFENRITGERLIFRQTGQESNGRRIEVDYFLRPHSGKAPVAHFHPRFDERFEIIAGQARYLLGTEEKAAHAGETVLLPHGVAHKHPWNAGDGELQVRQSIEPDQPDPATIQAIEHFFETLYGLGQDGKVNRDGLPNPLQFALILKKFQPHAYVAGIPIPVQQLLFGLLAGIGRMVGYRAVYPQYSAR
ncbi:MAG: cupin domain-containing protein [Caldilineaceae bacterium]